MENPHLFPPSEPPALEGGFEHRVESMVNWFWENFEDPVETLAYDSEAGGYQWVFGGPYEAREELTAAFPGAAPEEIDEAVSRLEETNLQWTPSLNRVPEVSEEEAAHWRHAHDPDWPHSSTIVETILYP